MHAFPAASEHHSPLAALPLVALALQPFSFLLLAPTHHAAHLRNAELLLEVALVQVLELVQNLLLHYRGLKVHQGDPP